MTSIFWDNVFTLLAQQDKSQKWLADASKVGKTVINSGISRKSSPTVDNALKIARVLGVTVEFLLTGNDTSGLSYEEKEFITKYKSLTADNKRIVRTLIDTMLPAVEVGGKEAIA